MITFDDPMGDVWRASLDPSRCVGLIYRVRFQPPNDRSYIQLRCPPCLLNMVREGWQVLVMEVL